MTPEIRKRWLSTLRVGLVVEGDDPQQLRDITGFNSMGVLCDIVGPERWIYGCYIYQFMGCSVIPPDEFFDEVGLTHDRAWEILAVQSYVEAIKYIQENIK